MKKLVATLFLSCGAIYAYAQLTCTISTTTNPSCNAGCNGSATVVATGGNPPFTYLWMPGNVTTQTLSNACAGSYTCTVTDNFAATCTSTITLVNPPALNVTTIPVSASICVGGSINFTSTPTGGTPPYAFSWNFPGGSPLTATTQNPTVSYNVVGSYTATLTVADGAGCTATANIPVTVNPTSVGGSLSGSSTVCSGSNGAIVLSGHTGNVLRWEMSLDGGVTWINISNTTTTQTFTNITVTTIYRAQIQSGSCPATYSGTATITVAANPTLVVTEIPATCNGTGTLDAIGSGGQPPYTYTWTPSLVAGPTYSGATPNMTHTVTVTDANGCTYATNIYHTDSCDYVWPGDANDDAVADNIDILDIGIANGATGTTRPNASLTWIGQPSPAWGTTLANGTDYKWVDCDGNGMINPIDTQAVVANFGMTHNNRNAAPDYPASAPALMISFDQDSLAAGSSGTITLSLGDAANQATGVYGVAFRLNYDAAQMNTSTFGMTGGTTWFGTPGNDLMRVVLHPSPANGYVDVAITRLDQQNVSGFGVLGQIYYTTTLNLNGTGNAQLVPMNLTNVVLVNNTGAQQPVNAVSDSIVVADPAIITGVADHAETALRVYPNPANETMTVSIDGNSQQMVTIEDLSGRIVFSQMMSPGINSISTVALPAGAYLIRCAGDDRASQVQQIMIRH